MGERCRGAIGFPSRMGLCPLLLLLLRVRTCGPRCGGRPARLWARAPAGLAQGERPAPAPVRSVGSVRTAQRPEELSTAKPTSRG